MSICRAHNRTQPKYIRNASNMRCVSQLRSKHTSLYVSTDSVKTLLYPDAYFVFFVIVNFNVWLCFWSLFSFFSFFLFFDICVCHLLFLLIKRYHPQLMHRSIGSYRRSEHCKSPTCLNAAFVVRLFPVANHRRIPNQY